MPLGSIRFTDMAPKANTGKAKPKPPRANQVSVPVPVLESRVRGGERQIKFLEAAHDLFDGQFPAVKRRGGYVWSTGNGSIPTAQVLRPNIRVIKHHARILHAAAVDDHDALARYSGKPIGTGKRS